MCSEKRGGLKSIGWADPKISAFIQFVPNIYVGGTDSILGYLLGTVDTLVSSILLPDCGEKFYSSAIVNKVI